MVRDSLIIEVEIATLIGSWHLTHVKHKAIIDQVIGQNIIDQIKCNSLV